MTKGDINLNRVFRCGPIALLCLLTLSGNSTHADEPIVPPEGGRDVLSFSEATAIRFHHQNVEASAAWAQIKGMPFSTAYRVDSDTRFSDAKNMRVIIPLDDTIKKGDVMLISFWMRRPKAGGQPNNASFYVHSGAGKPRYQYKLSAYRAWKQHVRSFVAPADTDSQQGNVSVLLGEAGTIAEIAELRLINYGPDYDIKTLPKSTVNYRGREPDAKWRKDALARIEKIRKGDLTVEVVDSAGNPVPRAKVRIEMQRHAFGFGNTVTSRIIGSDKSDFPLDHKGVEISWADAEKYRAVTKKYFDRVTFGSELRPHVWKLQMSGNKRWEKEYQILTTKTAPWLQAHQIGIRGHYIGWAPMDFNSIEKQFVGNPEAHRKWLWNHMSDVLPKTAGFVTEWDTINHIIGWGKHTYEREYGGPQIYADIMKEARRLAPDASHAINEGKVLPDGYKRTPYKKVIRFLNEQGQAPDMVGFMAHFGLTTLTPPEELLAVYDEFGEIAPSLQLSEFDVDAGDDDKLQSDYFRDVMIASFSHPNFEAIVQWGFWEKDHWKPQAALWRSDWTLKPSGEVFVDLVSKQWWTNENTRTDNNGIVSIRGFLGDYRITAERNGETAKKKTTVTRKGCHVRLIIP